MVQALNISGDISPKRLYIGTTSMSVEATLVPVVDPEGNQNSHDDGDDLNERSVEIHDPSDRGCITDCNSAGAPAS
jgi:hypothetical protein